MTIPLTMPVTVEPAAAGGDEDGSTEGEPPDAGADVAIGDERWQQVAGLPYLIPNLTAAALSEAGLLPSESQVSIALLSGAEVRTLNKTFRGKDRPANVLSFPAPQSAGKHPGPGHKIRFLGDVALSYDEVIEEAAAQDKSILDHSAHLIVHGILHLAGFDHGNDGEATRMENAERIILSRFGISDPYADPDFSPSLSL
jgi:probable rRNA maturation factor